MKIEGKAPKESIVTMRELVMPHHTNPQMTVFGGTVMSWVDIAASMCAARHCGKAVVTAHISDIDFYAPIQIGEQACIKASLYYTGKTSMIIGVNVHSENPYTKEKKLTTKAYLTFVALDGNGRPTHVPPVLPETDEEKKRYLESKIRVEERKKLNKRIKES